MGSIAPCAAIPAASRSSVYSLDECCSLLFGFLPALLAGLRPLRGRARALAALASGPVALFCPRLAVPYSLSMLHKAASLTLHVVLHLHDCHLHVVLHVHDRLTVTSLRPYSSTAELQLYVYICMCTCTEQQSIRAAVVNSLTPVISSTVTLFSLVCPVTST